MLNNLKNRIMVRVYVEFVKKIMLRRVDFILPGIFFLWLYMSVSVQSVFNNTPKDHFSHAFNYLFTAVRDTELFVQGVLAVLALWSFFIISKLTYRNIYLIKNFNLKSLNPLKFRY